MEETAHLRQGSTHPPVKKGSLRIYIMRFCPYAQRSLLVATAKGIHFDTVNVNLTSKPEWFLKLNPRGQVPVIELENKNTLSESIIVSDYMDELYQNKKALQPKDPLLKAQDRLLVERFNAVITSMFKLFFSIGKPDQLDLSPFETILKELEQFETELMKRGSPFFGGEKPGMLDYMIWPWFEREGILRNKGGEKLDIFFKGRFPQLKQWCNAMTNDEAVKKWFLSAEVHTHYLESHLAGNCDYDYLVKN